MYWQVPSIIPRQPGRKKLWLTADEHYCHRRILQYQNRPFSDLEEMNECLIESHNSVVSETDVVIHVGDFSFGRAADFARIAGRLTGTHFFMDGSHDRSMREYFETSTDWKEGRGKLFLLPKLFEFTFQKTKVVLCHYAMESWWASHYGKSSVHFHGHSHGRFNSPKQAIDVGVDTNKFFPYKIEDAIALAQSKIANLDSEA
jgi:calcineurin-like phosphoesterase family protein